MNHSEIAAVELATKNFYDALNLLFLGDDRAMKDIWSHADDVSYMGPEGLYLVGWEKIAEMWGQVAQMKLGGNVIPKKLHTVIGADLALITCVETGENEVDGKSESVGIRASTVFRKEGPDWRVIAHQTDLLSFMK